MNQGPGILGMIAHDGVQYPGDRGEHGRSVGGLPPKPPREDRQYQFVSCAANGRCGGDQGQAPAKMARRDRAGGVAVPEAFKFHGPVEAAAADIEGGVGVDRAVVDETRQPASATIAAGEGATGAEEIVGMMGTAA
ncbi:MAG: hypothetical protein A3F84_20820 [Candidatus Handelsmanbacteria bacterium RIFCSPLOWO2_12_FULL_64_10]|uniref:Uncharacterized protein n=1 Tax=Handelsmanbacteria sp. (strain RIFCSPLOWO2_12_FULL_64_10) TaxID=1817868 RepID=A0A1F6D4M8_HANXR|nr:MAG: hypothetical protein A3F84_20820 [Candidatus Handelsmanbacteria bacterium RIFCSPLOWO2_12_FULL_64_10]